MSISIQRLPEVKKRTGLSRSSIYQMMKDRSFPTQTHISKRSIGWASNEIDEWIASKIEQRALNKVNGGS